LSFVIVTHTFATGQAQEFFKYLIPRVKKVAFIGHPFSFSKEKKSSVVIYENGKEVQKIELPKLNLPEFLLYLKDIFYTLYFFLKMGEKFDVYFGANNFNASLGILFKKMGVVDTVIFNTIDYVPNRFNNRLMNKVYHSLDNFACYNSDWIWNLSPVMVEERNKKGVLEENAAPQFTVPIGCNFDEIKRKKVNEIDRYQIAYMGHLRPNQGIELVIESMPEVIKKVPKAKLLIIGTGPIEDELKRMVKKLKLENKVHFTGYVKKHADLEEMLTKCAIGVAMYVPSEKSFTQFTDAGKPRVYLGCGLPVIITKVPLSAFDIDKNKAGVAIDFNKKSFVNATVKLLKDDKVYKQYRKKAIDYGSEFNWKKVFGAALDKTGINQN